MVNIKNEKEKEKGELILFRFKDSLGCWQDRED
jgi:hypothetical protein